MSSLLLLVKVFFYYQHQLFSRSRVCYSSVKEVTPGLLVQNKVLRLIALHRGSLMTVARMILPVLAVEIYYSLLSPYEGPLPLNMQ